MEWLKQEWPKVVVTGLLQAIIGLIALVAIDETINNSDVRDIGIVLVWVAVILVGGIFLTARLVTAGFIRRGDTVTLRAATLEAEPPIPLEDSPPSSLPPPVPEAETTESPASGETIVDSVISRSLNPSVNYYVDDRINYYIDEPLLRRARMNALMRLKLGEIALLRRLAVSNNRKNLQWRCEEVLRASGVIEPKSSVARLDDKGLVTVDADSIGLTDLGWEFAWMFTQCMIHDTELVSAYRTVTPRINGTVRLDGKPLTD